MRKLQHKIFFSVKKQRINQKVSHPNVADWQCLIYAMIGVELRTHGEIFVKSWRRKCEDLFAYSYSSKDNINRINILMGMSLEWHKLTGLAFTEHVVPELRIFILQVLRSYFASSLCSPVSFKYFCMTSLQFSIFRCPPTSIFHLKTLPLPFHVHVLTISVPPL